MNFLSNPTDPTSPDVTLVHVSLSMFAHTPSSAPQHTQDAARLPPPRHPSGAVLTIFFNAARVITFVVRRY